MSVTQVQWAWIEQQGLSVISLPDDMA